MGIVTQFKFINDNPVNQPGIDGLGTVLAYKYQITLTLPTFSCCKMGLEFGALLRTCL